MSPLATLADWIEEARRAGEREPDAMALATSTAAGAPSVRVVYCRGIGDEGLVFFTNYESRKGREIEANPVAAAVFHWGSLRRQVRLEGRVEKVTPEASDAYFRSRARGSQIASSVSPQSQPVESLEALREACDALESRLAGADVPRPAHWGGYRLVPSSIELWTSGDHRVHDRVRYVRDPAGQWQGTRLAP